MMLHTIYRRIRNAIGARLGYGTCAICGDSWHWKRRHPLVLTRAMIAPYCVGCHRTKSVTAKRFAINETVKSWNYDEWSPVYARANEKVRKAAVRLMRSEHFEMHGGV